MIFNKLTLEQLVPLGGRPLMSEQGSKRDSDFINYLRGASILRVVLVHLGLSWIFLPYSSYIGIFLSVLFFCSGYIFLHLYRTKRSTSYYLFSRLVGILIPFYVVYGAAVLIALYVGKNEGFDLEQLLRVVVIAPPAAETPYPLGQIWYLRVLLFCALLSPFIFSLAKKSIIWILAPVVVAVIFSLIQSFMSIDEYFLFYGHNFYQEIVYGAYFFIGSFFNSFEWRRCRGLIALGALVALLVGLGFFGLSRISDASLAAHAYAPDMFFFSLGIFGILICLILVNQIEWIVRQLKLLRILLNYSSRHSYGIYLVHTFLIVFAEKNFGWLGISGDPVMAISKISFVVLGSMVVAYPITLATKRISKALVKLFYSRSAPCKESRTV